MEDLILGENSIGKFYMPKHDAISDTIAAGRIFDPLVIETINRYSGGNAIDVGSNFGQMTVLMSKLFDHVYSFEANPDLVEMLYKNLELNNVNNVTVISGLVWNESGVDLPFPEPDGRYQSLGSYGIKLAETDKRMMKSIKIDDYNIDNVTLMKFDIQGADLRGMQGAAETIKRSMPDIVFEYEQSMVGDFNESMDDYKSFIDSIGYKFVTSLGDDIIITRKDS